MSAVPLSQVAVHLCPEDNFAAAARPLLPGSGVRNNGCPLRQSDALGSGMDLSPRVIENIKRYLANSLGVLTPVRAVDFVFQQRGCRCCATAARSSRRECRRCASGWPRTGSTARPATSATPSPWPTSTSATSTSWPTSAPASDLLGVHFRSCAPRSHAPRGNGRRDALRPGLSLARARRDAERRGRAFPRGAWERGAQLRECTHLPESCGEPSSSALP